MANETVAGTTGTSASALPSTGGTSTGGIAPWARDYVTNLLGQTQALTNKYVAETPAYTGELTAGPSALQQNIFGGLGNLAFPSNLGQSFTSGSTPTPPNVMGGGLTGAPTGGITGTSGTGVAATYMNPYLQNVLQPQLQELNRQSTINAMPQLAKFTAAGAFGGDRQGLFNAETNRNLLQEQNKTIGTGYANAYDKAMQQFNTEQGQAKTLVDLISGAGATQRDIQQQADTAQKAEFERQLGYPQKMLEFAKSQLGGLPIADVTNTPAQLSSIMSLLNTMGGTQKALETLGVPSVSELLKGFGLDLGGILSPGP